jgi:acyl-CoA reductase-like NAD-dependent aldehyde dehydrogenase
MRAGRADTGRALVTGGCGKVIFIGSTTVGRAVMRDAAETLTPVTLELGGKDPFIVCDDTPVDAVAPMALRAAFQSAGQNCIAAERFIVQEGVYDAFVERVACDARTLRQGNPLGARSLYSGAW